MPIALKSLSKKRDWNTRPECDENDIVGKRFNFLTVLRFSHKDKYRHSHYLCMCDCGKEKTITKHSLVKRITKSCGCYHKEKIRKNNGEAAFNILYNKYKRTAKKRGRIFALSKYEFKKLTKGNCFYCGMPPQRVFTNGRKTRLFGGYLWNGIDRVNNNIGYIIKNSVSCCDDCNKAKRVMTLGQFKLWVHRVYKNLLLKGEKELCQ